MELWDFETLAPSGLGCVRRGMTHICYSFHHLLRKPHRDCNKGGVDKGEQMVYDSNNDVNIVSAERDVDLLQGRRRFGRGEEPVSTEMATVRRVNKI